MVYILIMIAAMSGRSSALSQEFNTKQACEAAAQEIQRQHVGKEVYQPTVIFCAAKGGKK
ncbi:hypothetical protein [Pseudomonas sp.]|uniref:hypothetical protein n=1 Tax=Pseudomonas sp. TaxID=306 RepID=UPI003FD8A5A7